MPLMWAHTSRPPPCLGRDGGLSLQPRNRTHGNGSTGVIGKWQLHPLYAKPEAWAQESLPSFPDGGASAQGSWYTWGYPQAGSLPPWGSVGAQNGFWQWDCSSLLIRWHLCQPVTEPWLLKGMDRVKFMVKRVLYTEAWSP